LVFSTPAKDQQTQKESNNSGFALDLDDSYFIQRLRVLEIIGPVSDSKSDRLHELRRPSLFYIISNSFVVPYYEGKVFFIEGGLVNKTELSDWQSVANYAYTVLNDNRTQAGAKYGSDSRAP